MPRMDKIHPRPLHIDNATALMPQQSSHWSATMKPEILTLVAPRAKQLAALEGRYTVHRYDLLDAAGREALLQEAGPRIRAIATSGTATLDAAMIARLPALEIVSSMAAGYEKVDTGALKARGIRFTTGSASLCDDVADSGILLMLASRRHLLAQDAYVRSGAWGREGMFPLQSSVRGKRLGILGMGAIGQALVPRGRAFGMEVAYFSRSRREGVEAEFQPDLLALAGWADVLIAILPGGAATHHIVDAAVLEALGPEGTFVNIARGSVVDEEALIAALTEGKIASAGLDVFANEPNPDPRLTALPNVTLMPHHASGTKEAREAMAQQVVDNIEAHFAGKPLLSPVI